VSDTRKEIRSWAVRDLMSRADDLDTVANNLRVAVRGACRGAGADLPNEYWEALAKIRAAAREIRHVFTVDEAVIELPKAEEARDAS
jgi:hypothetical protein